jgi:hypothetical protein
MAITANLLLRPLAAIIALSFLQCAAAHDPVDYIPANPNKADVAKHRVISSWTHATFELERGYVVRVERQREKVTKIEVVKDRRVFAVPAEFYERAAYVDFTRMRITRTDDPNDIPRVDEHVRGKAEFYLSLSFRDKTELESEGVRFIAFVDSPVLVMIRGLGEPIDLDGDLPQGPGSVTIAGATGGHVKNSLTSP